MAVIVQHVPKYNITMAGRAGHLGSGLSAPAEDLQSVLKAGRPLD